MKNSTTKQEGHTKTTHGLIYWGLIIGMISLTLSSCSEDRGIQLRDKSIKKWSAYEWKEVKTNPDKEVAKWAISSRKVKGTNFLEYKIEGAVDSTPNAFISWFKQDLHNMANGSENKKYPTYEIVNESNDSLLTYVIHNEPFPLKDTEMSVRYTFSTNSDGSAGVKWHEVWDEGQVEAVKKFKRVEAFRGSWEVYPADDNTYQSVNIFKFDPLKMPRWMFEPMVFKFLKEGLEELRGLTSY